MFIEEKSENSTEKTSKENLVIRVTNPMLYDRLHILSAEYSLSTEFLVNAAVDRLLDDIDFVRNLRNGKVSWK
ncbi:MAG: hypothetical protein IKJ15_08875 [Lachnospiraceae bacterium]|nr:hypothetical protein [Lachnospiraceae bacterium]